MIIGPPLAISQARSNATAGTVMVIESPSRMYVSAVMNWSIFMLLVGGFCTSRGPTCIRGYDLR
jgi:hypothetical protein